MQVLLTHIAQVSKSYLRDLNFTTCTGNNLYITTMQMTGAITIGGTIYPAGGNGGTGMTITPPYNNFKFTSKTSASPNGGGGYFTIVGGAGEGGDVLFRLI